jgi:probable Rubsico expression protein CbbX
MSNTTSYPNKTRRQYELSTELKQASAILHDLEHDLIGLHEVKARLRQIATMSVVEALRNKLNPGTTLNLGLNMAFTGLAGTGKTMLAEKIGSILYKLGVVASSTTQLVTREHLVGEFVGHTAPKTQAVLEGAIGGVLVIDDAHFLYKSEDSRDYGGETLEILLQFMENHRDDCVIILVGYPREMNTFFDANPGLASRVAHHIHFNGYTDSELMLIARKFAHDTQYRLTKKAEYKLANLIAKERKSNTKFSNARFVINLLELSQLKHAKRLITGGSQKHLTSGDLLTLDDFDIVEQIDEKKS